MAASALIEAIRANSIDRVVAALDDGANVEEADIHGYAGLPLRTACFSGNIVIIQALLERGADINAATADGPGALFRLATRAGHKEVIELLLAKNAQAPIDLIISPEILPPAQMPLSEPAKRADEHDPGLTFESISIEPNNTTATDQAATVVRDNDIEFEALPVVAPNPVSSQVFEQIEMKGVYRIDTNVLNIEFE